MSTDLEREHLHAERSVCLILVRMVPPTPVSISLTHWTVDQTSVGPADPHVWDCPASSLSSGPVLHMP